MNAAEAYRGVGGGRPEITTEIPDKFKKVESVMRSAPPPKADPRSPQFKEGTRCFRSRHPALSFPLFVTRDVQVGNQVIPGTHRIIRFNAVGNGDIGELVTDEAEVIARIEGHEWYANGTIVDAVGFYAKAKSERAAEIAAQVRADPMLREALSAEFGSELTDSFLADVKTDTEDKLKTKGKQRAH